MTAVDMGQFIAARSDQMNADDLLDGPRTITITKVTASPDSAEQPVSIHYDGDGGKPFKPCKTVRRIMVGVWGRDTSAYIGRQMTLYRDPTVAFGGMQVGGLRVSHMSDIGEKKTVALQVTRGRKAPYTVLPLAKDSPPPTSEDPASRWANAYIAKLAELSSVEAVQSFADEKAAKLAELEKARPDLHRTVTAALTSRIADLTPGGGFDDDLTGPDDEPDVQTNDAAGEKTAAEEAVDKVIAEADEAKDEAALETIIKGIESHKTFMPEDLQIKLEVAFDRSRQRLGAKAKAEPAGAK